MSREMSNAARQSYIKSLQKELNSINKRISDLENKMAVSEDYNEIAAYGFQLDELVSRRSETLYKMKKGVAVYEQ